MSELAAEVTRQSGKAVEYKNLPEADYRAALASAGTPASFAALLAASSVAVSKGALYDDSHQLSRLIGRPTTPLAAVVSSALKGR